MPLVLGPRLYRLQADIRIGMSRRAADRGVMLRRTSEKRRGGRATRATREPVSGLHLQHVSLGQAWLDRRQAMHPPRPSAARIAASSPAWRVPAGSPL